MKDTPFHVMRLGLVIAVVIITGCTTVGNHNVAALSKVEFGPPQTLRLCVLSDRGITEAEIRDLVTAAWEKEASRFGITLLITEIIPWTRGGFTGTEIANSVRSVPLPPSCDRVMAFVNRHIGDALWGLLLPELLGWANDETRTHGFVVARMVSLNQVFLSPQDVLRHELFHLLGCEHAWSLEECYERIALLKRTRVGDFFPAWDAESRQILASRRVVLERLGTVPADGIIADLDVRGGAVRVPGEIQQGLAGTDTSARAVGSENNSGVSKLSATTMRSAAPTVSSSTPAR